MHRNFMQIQAGCNDCSCTHVLVHLMLILYYTFYKVSHPMLLAVVVEDLVGTVSAIGPGDSANIIQYK